MRPWDANIETGSHRSSVMGPLQNFRWAGADPEISERGGRKPNSRKGGAGIWLFSATFRLFLINLLLIFHQKGGGGGGARPAPPLNPRLVSPNQQDVWVPGLKAKICSCKRDPWDAMCMLKLPIAAMHCPFGGNAVCFLEVCGAYVHLPWWHNSRIFCYRFSLMLVLYPVLTWLPRRLSPSWRMSWGKTNWPIRRGKRYRKRSQFSHQKLQRSGFVHPNSPVRQCSNECFGQTIITNFPNTNVFSNRCDLFPKKTPMQVENPLSASHHSLYPLMAVYCWLL